MDRIKLLIVDDSILFREVLSKCVQNDGTIEVIGKVGDAYAARDAILQFEPDVMTLDLEIPRMDGEDFLKKLLPQYYIPTIVISQTAERKPGCMSVGAVDFLAKPLTRTKRDVEIFAEDVCQAIRKAYKTTHPNAAFDTKGKPLVSIRKEPGSSMKNAEPSHRHIHTKPTAAAGSPTIANKVAQAPSKAADIQKVAAEAKKAVAERTQNVTPPNPPPTDAPKINYTPTRKFKRNEVIIALGASTGGTEALEQVIREFPADMPPVVIVQHMPAGFTKLYAERLNRTCTINVKEAEDGDRLQKGLIIIGAGERQMRVLKDSKGYYISSKPGEKVSGHCPSVDVLFTSVSESVGKNAIGAILTGMGRDGADGLKRMRDKGAFTIGQDKDSCVVYGMPMEAYKIGAVQVQAPLNQIAGIIMSSLS